MNPSSIDPEWVSVALTALAGVGAVFAFILGREEYQRAQLWKRKEFVAEAMKDFFADPQVRNALLLIDWAVRRVNVSLSATADPKDWPVVTRAEQIAALRPHTLLAGESDTVRDSVKDGCLVFSPLQASIRDTYDAFFDSFERFAGFVNAGLVDVDDLKPYLSYWIDDIASLDGAEEDRRWTLAVLAYIAFYSFRGTMMLFQRFGYDIAVGGERWQRLASDVRDRNWLRDIEIAYANGTCPQPPRETERAAGPTTADM